MEKNYTKVVKDFFNKIADKRDVWKNKNRYYHQQIAKLCKFIIPAKKTVLDIGCGTGDLLASTSPSIGIGLDISENMVKVAHKKYPNLKFYSQDAQNLSISERFDYVILSDILGDLEDIQKAFEQLKKVSDEKTRIIITFYNYLWEPILAFGEKIGIKMPQPLQNWLGKKDVENILNLTGLEVIKNGKYLLLPVYIPFFSNFINTYIARLPIIRDFCLVNYLIVRQNPNNYLGHEYSVSVIIPARNEAGNIENAVIRTPKLGKSTELIFVEGHSKDNTREEIERIMKKYRDKKNISFVDQGSGKGKADAVRKGFAKATGEILIILDADLTVAPEELQKFYQLLRTSKSEFVSGSRLVYPLEKDAMRFLNKLGNKFFSIAFTWLLDQDIKDTLCGTKALFRNDYDRIAANRSYFGEFDPFGDYDLIFGASKLNLKMSEIPVRYYARTYGTTNISRFKHGLLLLRMTIFAAKKLKFI